MFNDEDIIRIYKGKEFSEIPKNKLIEMFHKFSSSEEDQKRLATWENHFKDQKVPYAVVQMRGPDGKATTKSIWKEDLVEKKE